MVCTLKSRPSTPAVCPVVNGVVQNVQHLLVVSTSLSGYSAVGVPVSAPQEERHCHLAEGIGVGQQQPRQLADVHVPVSRRLAAFLCFDGNCVEFQPLRMHDAPETVVGQVSVGPCVCSADIVRRPIA